MIRQYPERKGKELTGLALCEFEAVRLAVEETERMPNGRARLQVVEMVLWKRTHTLDGAALQIPCGYETAKRWLQGFIRATAKNFCCDGLIPKE